MVTQKIFRTGLALLFFSLLTLSYFLLHRGEIGLGSARNPEAIYSDAHEKWSSGYAEALSFDGDSFAQIRSLVANQQKLLDQHRGEPSAAALHRTGFDLIQLALSGETKLWCHQLALIYVSCANQMGIPSRLVHIAGEKNGSRFTGHAFAESWIRELGQWAMVDPTTNIAYITDATGAPLTGFKLLQQHRLGATSDLNVHTSDNAKHPYGAFASAYEPYLVPGAHLVFPTALHETTAGAYRLLAQLWNPKDVVTDSPEALILGSQLLLLSKLSLLCGALCLIVKLGRRQKTEVLA